MKLELTGENGEFQFSALPSSLYYIRVTALGYMPYVSHVIDLNATLVYEFGVIHLEKETIQLDAVEIKGKRPVVETLVDRYIVNVDQLLSGQGSTVMDLLGQSPGITVGPDGGISIRGKSSVLVLIDGRQTFLVGEELRDYLKGLPSDQFYQVEIITRPSAKYDAAGTGGVINIKTKKGQLNGFNGTVSATGRHGRYYSQVNNLSVNFRKNNFNATGSYGYILDRPYTYIVSENLFANSDGMIGNRSDQAIRTWTTNHTHSARIGMDYMTPKTSIGVTYSGTFILHPFQYKTSYTGIFDAGSNLVASNDATRTREASNPRQTVNLYFQQQIGKKGQSLNIVADYMAYDRNVEYFLENRFIELATPENSIFSQIRQDIPSDINIYGVKVDYTIPFKGDKKLDVGMKSTYSEMNNQALFQQFSPSSGSYVIDPYRSVHYLFDEAIYAAYVNYAQPIGSSMEIRAGLRVERTNNHGREIRTGEAFDRDYMQWFPMLLLSYTPSEQHSWALNYSRRVNRPHYESLIPFAFYSDLLFYQTGNPYLRPEIMNTVDLSHTFADKLTTTFGYSQLNDFFSGTLESVPGDLVIVEGMANIANQYLYSLSMAYSDQVTSWYDLSAELLANHIGFQGELNGVPIDVGRFSWMVQLVNQFALGRNWSAEATISYMSPSQSDAISVMRKLFRSNLTVSKQILQNRGAVRLQLLDPFFSEQYKSDTYYQGLTNYYHYQFDSRRVGLSFTYRFGHGNTPRRQQKTSMEEETERL
ncbi:TonB-dependent receptor [Olivibacter sitiensis]|uniref:TonB-dependent receptor n=1 Tax=Olivibacter sitiensis TaxID=376470 RepID=UPI00048174CC|nr:TonB-dependent receptor [Olivibacter sitiensis]